jgi:hypothetical protein
MLRRLLNIASIVCLVFCVALMGMWVRSYRATEKVSWGQDISIQTIPGRLKFRKNVTWESGPWQWTIQTKPFRREVELDDVMYWRRSPLGLGFTASFDNGYSVLTLPYWFLVLSTGLLAILFRSRAMIFQLRWPWRFGLRSLFIATTFLAVLLAMVAVLDRAWIRKSAGSGLAGTDGGLNLLQCPMKFESVIKR